MAIQKLIVLNLEIKLEQKANGRNQVYIFLRRKFIDIEQVKSTATKLQKLLNEYSSSNEEVEKFMNMTRKLKRKSIRINIGSCIGVLGIVVPAIMVALRFSNKDNKEFQTKVEIENKLKQKESH